MGGNYERAQEVNERKQAWDVYVVLSCDSLGWTQGNHLKS